MNDKLVEKFLSNPNNFRMGNKKLADRWRASESAVRDARSEAKRLTRKDNEALAGDYIATLEEELVHRVNNEKGTLESTTTLSYEPRNDEELARLHKVDLTKYKISSYWSKLKSSGKFTSSIFCTLRKITDDAGIQTAALEEILRESFKSEYKVVRPKERDTAPGCGRTLLIVTTDEHVAAANLEDDLYNIPYDKSQYMLRKLAVIEEVKKMTKIYGRFDSVLDIKLGDDLDGWNGGTTRSGEPGHAHVLPQNMDNKKAIETYIRVNNWYWDELIKNNPANEYHKYDIVNSNHGGNGLDYIANLGVQIYLEAKHPRVDINYIHKFIGHIRCGNQNLILTHGKDENYRKRPLPLNLDPITDVFIKQYMEFHSLSGAQRNIVLKGDLHQWNWNSGKFFDYINIGSLYGSSGWVQANFGLTAPSFAIGWLDNQSTDFDLRPVYLETSLS